jgi:alkylated DNA repair dioxygenase AlkB
MSQLSLFESSETVLVDDASGRIAYTPRFVPAAIADAWFTELRHGVSWKAERRRMYDRDVDVPRLTAHFDLAADETRPGAIRDAARHVIEKTGVAFNSVGLNLYRDGRDSVAPHNDHLYAIVEGFPIALVSLGATRRMTIRAKPQPLAAQEAASRSDRARRAFHVALEPGSLLMMSYETQLHYTHGVPKTTEAVGERISLAFRVKPADGGYYS